MYLNLFFGGVTLSKRIIIFFVLLPLCSIIIGLLGIKMSLKELNNIKNGINERILVGQILSYDYSQYNKYANYYLHALVDEEKMTLEIPNGYITKFKRAEFEKAYSSNQNYTFVVSQDSFNKYGISPIIGLKSDIDIWLDEKLVLQTNSINAKLGLIVSSLLCIAAFLSIVFLCFKHQEFR